jgi:hypothetical protein
MTGGLATATFYVVSKPRESSQMGQEYGASADVAHESSMRVTFGPDALIPALFHAPAEGARALSTLLIAVARQVVRVKGKQLDHATTRATGMDRSSPFDEVRT